MCMTTTGTSSSVRRVAVASIRSSISHRRTFPQPTTCHSYCSEDNHGTKYNSQHTVTVQVQVTTPTKQMEEPNSHENDMSLTGAAAAPVAEEQEEENNANNDNDNDITDSQSISKSSATSKDSVEENEDNDSILELSSPEEAERLMLEAASLKEEGNEHFKAQKRDDAVRCYRRALHRLKKLKRQRGNGDGSNTDNIDDTDIDALDPQVVALWVTLSTNLSTVLFQTDRHNASAAAASQALELQPMHVKALYRRAVAYRKLGKADDSIKDLQTALTVEPTHTACRKELRSLQQSIQKANQQQKKALSMAFAGKISLYDDKEGPKQPTPEELEEILKQQWEDDCVARMARSETAISFEEWQMEQKEKMEKEKEEIERKEKEERQRKADERKAKREAQKQEREKSNKNDSSQESDDDENLTEAELQALRGYKKTKDGRITSYFTREISDEEKARLAQQGPQKLEVASIPATPKADLAPTATTTQKKKGPSAWNRAGTWEEKDCTEWCHDALRRHLSRVQTETCQIIKVDQLTGDASIVWTKGKQRHVFDFHATLHYAWTPTTGDDDSDTCKTKRAKGICKLPEISSTSTQEGLEVLFEGWKRQPASSSDLAKAVADRPVLEQALHEAVQAWLLDFHEHFQEH